MMHDVMWCGKSAWVAALSRLHICYVSWFLPNAKPIHSHMRPVELKSNWERPEVVAGGSTTNQMLWPAADPYNHVNSTYGIIFLNYKWFLNRIPWKFWSAIFVNLALIFAVWPKSKNNKKEEQVKKLQLAVHSHISEIERKKTN